MKANPLNFSSAQFPHLLSSYEELHGPNGFEKLERKLIILDPRSVFAMQDFSEDRWFTRGWSLQGLTAPKAVELYASDHTGIVN